MYGRALWEATPDGSWLYNLDARTKVSFLACFAVYAILIDSPKSLFLLFSTVLFLHFMAGTCFKRWQVMIWLIFIGMWGTMIGQAMFYNQEPRTIIACLASPATPLIGKFTGGIYLYREGAAHGIVQGLRSGTMLAAGLMLCWNTDPRQLLRCFLQWRMPYEIAFMLVTALRFLPVMLQEAQVVRQAQALRRPEKRSSFFGLKLALQSLLPVLARSLRRATTLALSVESRGFSRQKRLPENDVWPAKERGVCLLLAASALSSVSVKILCLLQYNGLFYLDGFRGIYDFCQRWM